MSSTTSIASCLVAPATATWLTAFLSMICCHFLPQPCNIFCTLPTISPVTLYDKDQFSSWRLLENTKMCIKNVVLFNCGHTRTLSFVCKYPDMECCPNTKRNLIPEEGGYGIEAPILKDKWVCALKCPPGVPAHDPLIDQARENVATVKKDIEHQIEILSVLSTPTTTPGITPGIEGGFNFDQRFAESLSRRRSGLTPAYERPALQWRTSGSRGSDSTMMSVESRDDLMFKFTDMKLTIPAEKLRVAGIEEEAEGIPDK